MGMMSLVKAFVKLVKPEDLIAFLVSAFIAYLISAVLPDGPWTAYVFILVFYHMFFAWLVIDGERRNGLSLPIVATVLTHIACLVIVVAFVVIREGIPYYGGFRFAIAGVAIFERNWLLSVGKKQKAEVPNLVPLSAEASSAVAAATPEDYDAWLLHLSNRDPWARKPGATVQDEYEQWMVARIKSRTNAPTDGVSA
jgi:hypothetical protein